MKKKIFVTPQLRTLSMNPAALMAASGESFNNGGGGDPGTGRAKGGYSAVSYDF